MKKVFYVLLASVALISMGCSKTAEKGGATSGSSTTVSSSADSVAAVAAAFTSENLELDSGRDTKIPATVVLPSTQTENRPLVVFAHGFMGSRDEAGGFTAVAEKLGQAGIASIRIDFPGSNESKDKTANFSLENNSQDLITAIEYMKATYKIDDSRIGMLGYSMGGRATSWVTEKVKLNTIVFWAPGISPGWETARVFGDAAAMEAKLAEAEKTGVSTVPFFGNEVEVGKSFLASLKKDNSFDNLSKYQGNVLMIVGGQDDIVTKEVTDAAFDKITSAALKAELIIPQVGHGMGIYEGDEAALGLLVSSSAEFFTTNLTK